MKIVSHSTFCRHRPREPETFENYELVNCTFDNCLLYAHDRERRSLVRRINAKNTTVRSSSLEWTVLEDVVVDGLRTSGVEFLYSCAFKHVVLKGRIGRIVVRPSLEDDCKWLDEFYTSVDWAVDISEAFAQELELEGIPARLIRRDPETQAVVRRSTAEAADWEAVAKGVSAVVIRIMIRARREDCVIIAPKGNKKAFAKIMSEIRVLREAG